MIERIKEAVSLADVLHDNGINLIRGRGRCPLCGSTNKTAFSVKGERAHCFVCGFSGDVIDLTSRLHGLDTRAAIKFLADKAGIKTAPLTFTERKAMNRARQERERRKALKKRYRNFIEDHALETARALRILRDIKKTWRAFIQSGLERLAVIQVEIDYQEYYYHEVFCNMDNEAARLELYKERQI